MKRLLVLAACAPLIAACATPTLNTPDITQAAIAREAALQRAFVVETHRDQAILLNRVMYRLSTAAVDLCGEKVAGVIGMTMLSAKSFAGEYEDIARSEFGFDDGLTVTAVMDDSPASYAGLRPGDRIVSIDGADVSASSRDNDRLQTTFRRRAVTQSPITMVVRRQGSLVTLTVTPAQACYYQASITPEPVINAMADGEHVYATKGLMNFVRAEEELALILSHEISHNALNHIEKKQQNRAVGILAGAVIDIVVAVTTGASTDFYRAGGYLGARAFSVEFEQEADYNGLYIMARAGYPIEDAANLWRRMAAEDPSQITHRDTHPTTPERVVAIQKAVDEVILKEARGLALVPNRESGQTMTALVGAQPPPTRSTVLSATPQRSVASLTPSALRRAAEPSPRAATEKPNLRVRGGTVTRNQSGPSIYLPDPYGAWIDDAEPGGPAADAGIRRADIVRTFNGHRVETFEELEAYAAETVPGSRVRLGVFRNRELITIEVDL